MTRQEPHTKIYTSKRVKVTYFSKKKIFVSHNMSLDFNLYNKFYILYSCLLFWLFPYCHCINKIQILFIIWFRSPSEWMKEKRQHNKTVEKTSKLMKSKMQNTKQIPKKKTCGEVDEKRSSKSIFNWMICSKREWKKNWMINAVWKL